MFLIDFIRRRNLVEIQQLFIFKEELRKSSILIECEL